MAEDHIIDARGLSCPLPVLKVRKAIRAFATGELVRILATDPLAEQDFRDFCRVSGCAFVSANTAGDGVLEILIRVDVLASA